MANEATVGCTLNITKGNIQHRANPSSFTADVTSGRGPAPGLIVATVAGTDVDLSALTTPAFCHITNQDSTNIVDVGVWDGVSFYPLLEIQPGKATSLRISSLLSGEYGTGAGTTGSPINTMRVKARVASCDVVVNAFEA